MYLLPMKHKTRINRPAISVHCIKMMYFTCSCNVAAFIAPIMANVIECPVVHKLAFSLKYVIIVETNRWYLHFENNHVCNLKVI